MSFDPTEPSSGDSANPPIDGFAGALSLRPMAETDIEAVADLVAKAMSADEGARARKTFDFHFGCRRLGMDDGRTYFVLADGRTVNGVVGLHFYHWGPTENVWLAWFALEPSLQGTGLGKGLMDFVTQRAVATGYSKLFIETYSTPEFAAARRFYEAKGFVRSGSIASYLPDGGDMVVYSKELTHDA